MALIVKGDFGSDAYTRLNVWYRDAFNQAPEPQWPQIATRFDSDTETEVYDFLGEIPSMREFLDERVVRALGANSWGLTNKKWETTIGVDRADMERNKLGHIRPRIQNLGFEAKRAVDRLLLKDVVNNLTTGSFTSIDGKYTCSASHSWPGLTSSVYVNVHSAGFHATSVDLTVLQNNLAYAEEQMAGFLDDQGNPLNDGAADTIICGPALRVPFMRLLTATDVNYGGVGQSNVFKGAYTLVVNRWKTDRHGFELLNTGGTIKPFVFQEEVAPEFTALDNPAQDSAAFWRDHYFYGLYGRWNAGAPLWWKVVEVRSL